MCIMRLRRVVAEICKIRAVLRMPVHSMVKRFFFFFFLVVFSRSIRVNKHCTYILPVISYDSIYIDTFECRWLVARLFYTRVRKICKSLAPNL